MKVFQESHPPESTSEVVNRLRLKSKLGYWLTLLMVAGLFLFGFIMFTILHVRTWGGLSQGLLQASLLPIPLYLMVLLLLLYFEARLKIAQRLNREAALHERVIELMKKIGDDDGPTSVSEEKA